MFYILYRFLNDPNIKDKSFAISFRLDQCFTFHHKQDDLFVMREFKSFSPDDNFRTQLFIFDSLTPQSLLDGFVSNWDVVLASPNPNRFKYIPGLTYYMPVWTYEELKILEPDTQKWDDLYQTYGGVPRYLLGNYRYTNQQFKTFYAKTISRAIREKAKFIVENFTIYEHNSQQGQDDANHMLVHLNPAINDNGSIDHTEYTEFFASECIMGMLKSKYEDLLYKKAVSMLNSGDLDVI